MITATSTASVANQPQSTDRLDDQIGSWWRRVSLAVGKARDRRYRMRGDDELRGPLAIEYRQSAWF